MLAPQGKTTPDPNVELPNIRGRNAPTESGRREQRVGRDVEEELVEFWVGFRASPAADPTGARPPVGLRKPFAVHGNHHSVHVVR